MVKSIMTLLWAKSKKKNDTEILKLLSENPSGKILDLGCNDGAWTIRLGKKIKSKHLYGIEINEVAAKKAIKKAINVKIQDLNQKFEFEDNFFDIVHANQVIEHLVNVDNFVVEILRVLKPKGYAIISTENLSAWDNLFALLMGQQAFSQHISEKWHIGNKFSPHFGERIELKSWSHKIIFTYFGLKQLFQKYGFKNITIKSSGHFPLPNCFDYIDPVHSHFITLKGYKP